MFIIILPLHAVFPSRCHRRILVLERVLGRQAPSMLRQFRFREIITQPHADDVTWQKWGWAQYLGLRLLPTKGSYPGSLGWASKALVPPKLYTKCGLCAYVRVLERGSSICILFRGTHGPEWLRSMDPCLTIKWERLWESKYNHNC